MAGAAGFSAGADLAAAGFSAAFFAVEEVVLVATAGFAVAAVVLVVSFFLF